MFWPQSAVSPEAQANKVAKSYSPQLIEEKIMASNLPVKLMSIEGIFIAVGLIGVPLAIIDGLAYGWFEAGVYAAFPAGMLGSGVYSIFKKQRVKSHGDIDMEARIRDLSKQKE